MTIANLRRRLDRVQARRGSDRITTLANLAAHPPEIVAEAIRDWRQWVADHRANRHGSTLILRAPRLTVKEWVAQYTPRTGSLH